MDVLLADAGVAALRLRRELERYDFRVHPAQTRAEAEGVLDERVLTGVVLEAIIDGRSTLDLVRPIRARLPSVPIVFVTCYPSLASAQAAIRLGATDYVTKPVTAAQLAAMLLPGQASPLGTEEPPFELPHVRREYILEIVSASKTLSEAARVLGLDRRSLRRMLERHGLRKAGAAPGVPPKVAPESFTERVCSTSGAASAGRYPAARPHG